MRVYRAELYEKNAKFDGVDCGGGISLFYWQYVKVDFIHSSWRRADHEQTREMNQRDAHIRFTYRQNLHLFCNKAYLSMFFKNMHF